VVPSSFYGTIQVDSANIEPGTSIKALIQNQVIAEGFTLMYEGASVYTINVPGDDNETPEVDGGREGEQIFFEVGGLVAEQTGTWHSGTNVELNLTVSSQDQDTETIAVDTPSPTHTINQPEDSRSTQSTQTVHEPTWVKDQTETPTGSSNPAATVSSSTPQPAKLIPSPTQIDEAIPVPTTVNIPELSLGDSQVKIQSEIVEQASSDQTSSAIEESSPRDQFTILSRPELFRVIGGIIVIGAAAILIWTQRK
jgi:hypothetical protein